MLFEFVFQLFIFTTLSFVVFKLFIISGLIFKNKKLIAVIASFIFMISSLSSMVYYYKDKEISPQLVNKLAETKYDLQYNFKDVPTKGTLFELHKITSDKLITYSEFFTFLYYYQQKFGNRPQIKEKETFIENFDYLTNNDFFK